MGASADGIGNCDCHGKFLIEIKCPYKHRNEKDIESCLQDKKFCLDKNLHLKTNHRYFTQVQMQMAIYGVKVCHFVVWGPHFCKGNIITYSEDFNSSISSLVAFHKKVISQELVSRKLETSQVFEETESLKEQVEELVCYCQKKQKVLVKKEWLDVTIPIASISGYTSSASSQL